MCILFVYLKKASKGKYKMVLASNRDEFYVRPAKVAGFWAENPSMLGGRDMEPGREGGTWLAMNKVTGRIGVLLNITTPNFSKDKKGRGRVVSDYTTSTINVLDYCQNLNSEATEYNPFNFVAVDSLKNPSGLTCYCSDEGSTLTMESDEFYGFGNSPYSTPYQKVTKGLEEFQTAVQTHGDEDSSEELTTQLLQLLKSEKRQWPDYQLQKQATAFRESFQQGLSSVFASIPAAKYGTRTHTIITVDNQDNCRFQEWTMKEPIPDAAHAEWVHTSFEFHLGEL